MNGIYLHRDRKQFGPYSTARIREFLSEGRVLFSDLTWVPGEHEWIALGRRAEFADALPPPVPHSTPIATGAVTKNRSPHWCWLGVLPLTSGIPHMIFGQIGKGILTIVLICFGSVRAAATVGSTSGALVFCSLAILDAFAVGCQRQEHGTVTGWAWFPSSTRCNFKRRRGHFVLLLILGIIAGLLVLTTIL
jgi:hypothetical protein